MRRLLLPEDAVVQSTRGANLRPDRAKQGTWQKLRPGWYLRASSVPQGLETWEVARLVTIARARAAWRASDGAIQVTNQSAMVAQGLDTWLAAPDTEFKKLGTPRPPLKLPAVEVGGVVVPAVWERQVTGPPRGETEGQSQGAVRYGLPPAAQLAVDMARTAHPIAAVGAVSTLLDKLIAPRAASSSWATSGEAGVDRWEDEWGAHLPHRGAHFPDRGAHFPHRGAHDGVNSPSVEEQRWAQGALLELLESVGSSRFRSWARSVILAARAGTESVGEGFLLWLLACALPEKTARNVVTQQPVRCGHRMRRIDAALPELRVGFEFDGGGKLVADPNAARAFLQRHRELEQAGWQLVRLSSGLMLKPAAALSQLREDCQERGVPLRRRPGPLWVPVPRECLARTSSRRAS